ncbi:NADH-quinone oxidoreductase subunit NuoG [Chitinimonas sp. BJB300]|uniref:NADH-quinone oxidoreductase subunit NuoG n=1 Tax=Chitinimonas sp. BJB300 TaxID=1559339 RepID=UPI000C0C735A|nr:NADH-quinone oxidoreductase subunit NuoG [Chitinimonas sp. BJB300]PHV10795.1 NADH-quinone oxidoreductase subunit G [Chitinimonas sp. BJB300]TSJ87798.1 NADH-quinone oxidoreductase subunit G [Chitinimonas sp. BJB300]
MLEIEIDGTKLTVPNGTTVIEAARSIGTHIPHFCYHKKLSIAANCRMCLVQVEKAPKPLPACATPVNDGMKVFTHSDMAVKAQQGVMEFLLINHPLDCPICDQGGECQLQDLAVGYGGSNSRYEEEKRVVPNKDLGPLISTDMTRCIHCTRCVRFTEEVAGMQEIGMAGRGEHSEIMSFIGMTVDSEISGNVIDLCPVGALTSKPFRYTARTWELSRRKSVSPHDGLGANLIVQVKSDRVMRVLPLENEAINECWIADRDRFAYEALNSEQRLTKPMLKQGGQWIETDWQSALEYVGNGLKSISREYGAESIAVVGTPHSTLEELFLLNKLSSALGAGAASFAGRYADARLTKAQQGATWLGLAIGDVAQSKAVVVVGSTIRKEQPLLAQRLRQAVKRGLNLSIINPMDDELFTKLSGKLIVRPDQMVEAVAAVVKAAAEHKQQTVPAEVADVVVSDDARSIAKQLVAAAASEGGRATVLLGNLAAHNPRAAEIAALANQLAAVTGATLGWMSEAANTVGAQVLGMEAGNALVKPRKAVLLFNTEVEFDSHDAQVALATVKQAEMVVAFSAFKHAGVEYADVLLPITPFSETAGSFVNMEGKLQTFNGVVKPLGDSRPGWKVLRVLGNLLGLEGFDFDNAEAVRKAALPQGEVGIAAKLNNAVNGVVVTLQPAGAGLVRLGEVPIYQGDALVRRAPSLQKTRDAAAPMVSLSAATAKQASVAAGDKVQVKQGDAQAQFTVAIDAGLAEGVVRLPVAHPKTVMLGAMFAPIQLTRA